MLPSSYNAPLVGQQGLAHQAIPQQSLLEQQQQPPPGMMNSDQARVWQQMQHIQNQYRPQAGGDNNVAVRVIMHTI